MLTESCPKVAHRFYCEICHYYTNKKSSFNKHITTAKHLELTNVNLFSNKSCSKVDNKNNDFNCKTCNKIFHSRVGLWKHTKKCIGHQTNTTQNKIDKDEVIMMLIKENSHLRKEQSDIKELIFKEQADIKEIILEIVKNGTMNNSHNTTTNSHNKAFNLQFFLNETCKNAMNITDFVESIKLQLSDFMSMGDVGFVEGISNIIVKNLNSLDETIRPIHCTDQKRETFYVKDENKWEKEEEDKKLIRGIAYKNEKLMKVYKETYPDYNNPESCRSEQYSKIMIEAMDSKNESREKIIKKISNVTAIEKK